MTSKRNLQETAPPQLAHMLSCDTRTEHPWNPDELAAILRHQLSLSPEIDLYEDDQSGKSPADDATPATVRFADYWELLTDSSPPLPMLRRMKKLAKSAVRHPDSPLPEEVATTLYFAAIAAALVHCQRRISRLNDDGLQWGFQWALDQPWLDDNLRSLFRHGLSAVGNA